MDRGILRIGFSGGVRSHYAASKRYQLILISNSTLMDTRILMVISLLDT